TFTVHLQNERDYALQQRDEATQAREDAERQRDGARLAREEAEKQREQARHNYALARQAVDTYARKASEDPRLQERGVEQVRLEWLQEAGKFYEAFLKQQTNDPTLRLEQAQTTTTLADITYEIGTTQQAERRYRQAEKLWQALIRDQGEKP